MKTSEYIYVFSGIQYVLQQVDISSVSLTTGYSAVSSYLYKVTDFQTLYFLRVFLVWLYILCCWGGVCYFVYEKINYPEAPKKRLSNEKSEPVSISLILFYSENSKNTTFSQTLKKNIMRKSVCPRTKHSMIFDPLTTLVFHHWSLGLLQNHHTTN